MSDRLLKLRAGLFAFSASIGALGAIMSSASAAVIMHGTDLTPISLSGFVSAVPGSGAVSVPGLTATLDLGPAVFFGGNFVQMSYTLTNTTDSVAAAPAITSVIRGFGFNVDGGTLTNLFANVTYTNEVLNSMVPMVGGLGGVRDACFALPGGNGCTGGPITGGLGNGQSASGVMTLTFAGALTSFTIDDFAVRFQALTGVPNGETSGIGVEVASGVPEPSTWAMMFIGFAGLAWTAGRRRRQSIAAA